MKQFINISTLFFFIFFQGCVSNQKFLNSEARRVFAESEANKLRLDTMGKAQEIRFLRKSAVNYVDKISLLTIDTTTLAKQTRECWKQNYQLLANQGGSIKNLQETLAQKELELAEKEKKMENMIQPVERTSVSSAQMTEIFSLVKRAIGSFATNGVEISLKNDIIWISVPENMMFEQYGMNVIGKGLAITLKLSEVLKAEPALVTTLYVYSQNIDLDSPLFNENWNTCALRSSALAQVLIRYGVPPYQITSAAMIDRDTGKGKVEIAIIGK